VPRLPVIAAAKGQVSIAELQVLKDLSEWLGIDRRRQTDQMIRLIADARTLNSSV
jgi:DnaJ-domain-containing protein 1